MGRADAAVMTNESYQNLAAAQIIIEAAGGKVLRMDGEEFHINEYLESENIVGGLLVTAAEKAEAVMALLKPVQ
jgi:myo-inositol-1(or 4)-monophosphatase